MDKQLFEHAQLKLRFHYFDAILVSLINLTDPILQLAVATPINTLLLISIGLLYNLQVDH